MLTKYKSILFLSVVLSLCSCEPIRDSYTDCGVWLEFVFEHNMEFEDRFDPHVKTVDVYVFNDAGRYVTTRHAAVSELDGRKRMFLEGVPFGNYKVLTVGNLAAPFSFAMGTNPLVAGVTTMEEVLLSLDTAQASREFDHLFFGPAVDVTFKADLSTWKVPLIRTTNRFHIRFFYYEPTAEGTRADVDPIHTVAIVAPESGAYDRTHSPVNHTLLTYSPYLLQSTLEYNERNDAMERATFAKINTMRLLRGLEGYRLSVRDITTNREVWHRDLLSMIAGSEVRPIRPDGTSLPMDEYLDREGDWYIDIRYEFRVQQPDPDSDTGESFVALMIRVNNWIIWDTGVNIGN
ncbi:MAG: FimB/Mfa2 family fimbrial subunit [Tannerellaceae bacterium]|jgi:hypothetical protein|nr:FimB/Mfa2 family fimbrial subunit [Tannerellaceae bacterium]